MTLFSFFIVGYKESESKIKSFSTKQEVRSETNKVKVIKASSFSSGSVPSIRRPLCDDTNNQTWLKQKPAPDKGILCHSVSANVVLEFHINWNFQEIVMRVSFIKTLKIKWLVRMFILVKTFSETYSVFGTSNMFHHQWSSPQQKSSPPQPGWQGTPPANVQE